MTVSSSDYNFMAQALQLAEQGLDSTSPNPRVGCIICDKDGNIVGRGFHQVAGQAHAEILALEDAGTKAKGATAYLTLEPCSHHGKTGPCADALIEAGISRLVYAMEDPNPKVAGDGLLRLKEAGIEVDGPIAEDQARKLNKGFVKRMETGLPWLTCKMAMSFDGRTAMGSGESKWITGPDARKDVQRLRARSCAIVTGVDSVIHDDPALTVRLKENARQPLRVVVDSKGRCPEKAEILEQPGETVIASGAELTDEKRTVWKLPLKNDRVNLRSLMSKLAERQCNEVLLETGSTLAGAFFAEGLIDELVIYMAPTIMGSSARPLFDIDITKMNGQLPLIVKDIRAIGEDWRFTMMPDPEG